MTSKSGKSKKKKSVVLPARDVEMVDENGTSTPAKKRRVVVKKGTIGRGNIKRGSALESKGDQTVNVDVPDDPEPPVPNIAQLPEGKPVDLNDPSIKSQVEQRPLDPSQTQRTPQPTPPREVLGEPTFKFFCYRCGQKLQVPVSWANKSYPCGRCHNDIVIPPPLNKQIW